MNILHALNFPRVLSCLNLNIHSCIKAVWRFECDTTNSLFCLISLSCQFNFLVIVSHVYCGSKNLQASFTNIFGLNKPLTMSLLFNSGENWDGEIETAELRARKDLEAFRHRQGWFPRRRRVRPRHAPHTGEGRRPRPPLGAASASCPPLETQLSWCCTIPML